MFPQHKTRVQLQHNRQEKPRTGIASEEAGLRCVGIAGRGSEFDWHAVLPGPHYNDMAGWGLTRDERDYGPQLRWTDVTVKVKFAHSLLT